jgi:hypothetical protein
MDEKTYDPKKLRMTIAGRELVGYDSIEDIDDIAAGRKMTPVSTLRVLNATQGPNRKARLAAIARSKRGR